jgi:hypothetical protein
MCTSGLLVLLDAGPGSGRWLNIANRRIAELLGEDDGLEVESDGGT